MKSKSYFLIIMFVLVPTFAMMWVGDASMQKATTATTTIADLAWMSGDWQTAAGGTTRIEEHWTLPAGGTMLGMGRTILGEKTTEFEFLRIEQRVDGIYYVANPQGGPPTDFKMTGRTTQEVIFENPEHDFPKRIIYRKNSDGSLVASVDGGEKTTAQTFHYLPFHK